MTPAAYPDWFRALATAIAVVVVVASVVLGLSWLVAP
jgi:hypothetical protein